MNTLRIDEYFILLGA
ncbi:hypothetical protein I314_06781 [Cryptococcus bacillisporus CA1873]|uniref:Uncharacterized protein n=1 Tax=Cryptococcus bacillisporus CA1873 TaxID=1296111 RepID=A0ABR5B1F6_CRYGA|nr:hypothetical protein I314_06781 [Cryptococcus bacillisporus CA1873]|eukprot:KIR57408.1 hypothetical protein I314_06781 [Cryptococcus gattii CA1873]